MTRAALLTLAVVAFVARAEPRAIPFLSGPVVDEARVLTAAQHAQLESELRRYPPALQLQVWITPSLGDDTLESLSIRAVETWKLGRVGEDRGALLLVSIQERAVRIEVGRGLEGEIPDIIAGRLIREVFVPAARAAGPFEAVWATSRALYEKAGGDASKLGAGPRVVVGRRGPQSPPLGSSLLIIVIFVLFILANLLRLGLGLSPRRYRRGPWWGGGGGWGGGGFGGGFGGGWSGGGGGFSGGGASGRW